MPDVARVEVLSRDLTTLIHIKGLGTLAGTCARAVPGPGPGVRMTVTRGRAQWLKEQ